MDDPIIVILKWCFLLLIYLFFYRVLQAVWKGSTTRVSVQQVRSRSKASSVTQGRSSSGGGRPIAKAKPQRILVLEPGELAGAEYPLEDEISIGRSKSCQIHLDSNYISQLHARMSKTRQGIILDDLGSTNGTFLNNEKITRPTKVQLGDRIRVGNVLMELR